MNLELLHARRPMVDEAGISPEDADNLYALIMERKPKTYIEIGTAAGISTAYVIQAFNELDHNGRIYAFDALEHCYYATQKPIGWALAEMLDEIRCHLDIFTKASSLDIPARVKEPIDFAFIDGSHGHPWATIDTIAVLPFLSQDAVVAYHDINLPNLSPEGIESTGPKLLFELVSAKKMILGEKYQNLGIIWFEQDYRVYIDELIGALEIPWNTTVDLEIIAALHRLIAQYYGQAHADALIERILIPKAETCFYSGQIDTAIRVFMTITKLNPLNAEAFNNLSVCFLELGDLPSARTYLQQALKLEPDNTLFRDNLNNLNSNH